ncbi:hypothetical protein TNCV_654461 [Trichonephila clavipes]|nr:hypothetical protein TNCV_654461 [Trichonephila clavipes]
MVDTDILIQIWKNRVKKIDFVLKWLSRVGSEVGPTKVLYEGDTRNRWRDGQVCPDVGQGTRVCFGVLCANRTSEVKRDFGDLPIRRDEGRVVNTPLVFKRVFLGERKGDERRRKKKGKETEKDKKKSREERREEPALYGEKG